MRAWVAAAAGALVGAAIVALLYEKQVVTVHDARRAARANESDGREPSKRDDATAAPPTNSDSPSPKSKIGGPEGGTREELIARARQQDVELARLRDRVHALEEQASHDGKPENAPPFYAPSHDQLLQMAKECKLSWDMPAIGFEPDKIGPKRAAQFGLNDAEVAQYNQAAATENARALAELRQLYIEVTGDRAGADSLTPKALEHEIAAKSPEGAAQQVFQRMAQERAGLIPPGDGKGSSPLERMMQLLTTLGDDWERDLGGVLGPDLAHAMRTKNGGWGDKSTSSYGCPEQH
jgi:hypothetical protein